jgi:hypothetical protein
MAYLKCVLAGGVSGVIAAVAWIAAQILFILPGSTVASGSGGLGAVSGGLAEVVMPSVLGFALGFYLMLRRQRARTARR